MPALRLVTPTFSTSLSHLGQLRQLRCAHKRTIRSIRWRNYVSEKVFEEREEQEEPKRELSLLEELFPEESKRSTRKEYSKRDKTDELPRLRPPEFDDGETQAQRQSKLTTRAASTDAFRHSQITVLLLSQASKSLTEDDFRRIAPRGKHIDEWKGPGDIVKGAFTSPTIMRYLY